MPHTLDHLPLYDLKVLLRCRRRVHAVSPLIAGNAGGGNIVRLVTSAVATRLEVFCSALERFYSRFAESVRRRKTVQIMKWNRWQFAVVASAVLTSKGLLTITDKVIGHGSSGNGYFACHLRNKAASSDIRL